MQGRINTAGAGSTEAVDLQGRINTAGARLNGFRTIPWTMCMEAQVSR